MCSEKSNIRVTREPSNFRSENCIESKSHDLEIIRFLSNIFKTVVTVYPNRIQNPTFVWRLLYWILIEPENRTIENFSTRVRKIPSTYPDCNTRWIYTTASQGLIGGFTFSTFYIRMGVLFTMGVLPPCILHVYIIPFAEQENYNRPGERSF